MSRYDARKTLNRALKWRAVGHGHMQADEHGGFVYLSDYNRAVRKAVEEQRAAKKAGQLVGQLVRLIEDLGSTKLEHEMRKLLANRQNCLTCVRR